MNTTHDVLTGAPGVLPCGCMVEVVGSGHVHPEPYGSRSQSGSEGLKSTALAKLDDAKRSIARTSRNVRREAMGRVDQLRRRAAGTMERTRQSTSRTVATAQSSMRTNPMKWIGVAAGAGLGIGLVGRLFDHRRHHRPSPQLVIIETEC